MSSGGYIKIYGNPGFAAWPVLPVQGWAPLTRDRLVTEMRKAMSLSGVDSKQYLGHSFRIRAATTAVARGCKIPS